MVLSAPLAVPSTSGWAAVLRRHLLTAVTAAALLLGLALGGLLGGTTVLAGGAGMAPAGALQPAGGTAPVTAGLPDLARPSAAVPGTGVGGGAAVAAPAGDPMALPDLAAGGLLATGRFLSDVVPAAVGDLAGALHDWSTARSVLAAVRAAEAHPAGR
ncbi:hypothetical protein GCM10011594_04360 [Nakamurella endophytica]|uniref:Uncharacterized protein n=1 Tax=Nakamurella endophytica TaxID=1748367 RepID=A0A917WA74_9ACTN|nr:hypothetical protein GCM10011594_04360 [Nakamurella endophytica]